MQSTAKGTQLINVSGERRLQKKQDLDNWQVQKRANQSDSLLPGFSLGKKPINSTAATTTWKEDSSKWVLQPLVTKVPLFDSDWAHDVRNYAVWTTSDSSVRLNLFDLRSLCTCIIMTSLSFNLGQLSIIVFCVFSCTITFC